MWTASPRGVDGLSRCNISSKAKPLDSRVALGSLALLVGQNVQPNPHHMEVCDEHREESDGW